MYTIDRLNRIRLTLGMTTLHKLHIPMSANDEVRSLEVFCGIGLSVENYLYKKVHDYIGRRIHRLEVHCGVVPFDSPGCVCHPRQNERCICGSRRHPRHISAGADLSGAHTFWLGAEG